MKTFNGTNRLLFLVTCICVLMSHSAFSQELKTQSIDLNSGWNLIAFQVIPGDPSPASVFNDLGSNFVAAWSYDLAANEWTQYANPSYPGGDHNAVNPLSDIEFGRAYWIYMNSPITWEIYGCEPDTAIALNFGVGWNLVGIPAGSGDRQEQVSWLAILSAAGGSYDTILMWENGLYKKYTTDEGDVDDPPLPLFDPDKGHWVHVTSSFTLQPQLQSSVRADVDAAPQGNFPSYEDLELDDNGTGPVHNPSDQTHIIFFEDEDLQQLAITNSGGGILLWDLEWMPTSAPGIDWLVDQNGDTLNGKKGITTVESDVIYLCLDRKNLTQGDYQGVLRLRTSAGDREFTLIAHISGLQGEWRGNANIETANGRANELPRVDLHIDFFPDKDIDGLIHGMIDSQNALLWPVDVPLIGHIISDDGNSFMLSGSYVLPPGDQNIPPYDTFTGATDVDWMCDGNLDDTNPYPFPIYREVMLLGELVTASYGEGYRIEGNYLETIFGMLPHPIELFGSFYLTREGHEPFGDRNPSASDDASGTVPVVTGQSSSSMQLPPGTRTSNITLQTNMMLQDLSVELNIMNVASSNLKITLRSPSGTGGQKEVILHDRASIGSLTGITFPGTRNPVGCGFAGCNLTGTPLAPSGSFDDFIENVVLTKGTWSLIINNNGSATGQLSSWKIRLQGQPLFDIYGQVVDSTSKAPLPAQVVLEGMNITKITTADADGSFSFSDIPGIPLNFTATHPGYEPYDMSMHGLSSDYTVPRYHGVGGCNLSPYGQEQEAKFASHPLPAMPFPGYNTAGWADNLGTPANPVILEMKRRTDLGNDILILALPDRGSSPLTVQFTLFDPAGVLSPSSITWNFDDTTGATCPGNAACQGVRSITHTFESTRSTPYHVSAQVAGGNTYYKDVVVYPSPSDSPYVVNFFQIFNTGGGTLPNGFSPQATPLLQIQQVDCAGFDIDRQPLTPYAAAECHPNCPGGLSKDFLADGLTSPLDNTDVIKGEDTNYRVSIASGFPQDDNCGYTLDDTNYHQYPRVGATGDCLLTRYRMVCNIGTSILPPTINTENPPPGPTADGIAKARGYYLYTGPLATFWKE